MARIDFGKELRLATFLKRANRFSALVKLKDSEELVYVANSGRMKELLLPGVKVYLSEQKDLNRKTQYDLEGVYKDQVLVSIDSRIPNLILEKAFLEGLDSFRDVTSVRREVTIGKSRLDFLLTFTDRLCYVEAKSVTLVEDGVAKFPDAPTERGSKHLLELIELVKQGNRAAVIFVIQREDATIFSPNHNTDPEFAINLKKALKAGVEVYAYVCQVDIKGITLVKKISVQV